MIDDCRLAGEMEPKTKELDLMNKSLLKFQTDAVLDAGTPPKRTAQVYNIFLQNIDPSCIC